MMKFFTVSIILVSFFLSSCASVNSRGEYQFQGAKSKARAMNALGGAAMGLAAGLVVGRPVEGLAAGTFVGAVKDPNECSEGYADSESANAPIAGDATGAWKGTAHRDNNKRCGNRRGGGWLGFAPTGRDAGPGMRTSQERQKKLPYCDEVMPGWACIQR